MPTQTQHPWRATVRTMAAALVAALVIAPQIITEAGLDETVYGAQALAVIGVVTRILAVPGVEAGDTGRPGQPERAMRGPPPVGLRPPWSGAAAGRSWGWSCWRGKPFVFDQEHSPGCSARP